MRRVALFVAVAYGWSWLFHGYSALAQVPEGPVRLLLYLVGQLGPLLGALVVTYRSGGSDGVRTLLARGARWRCRPSLYLVALLTTTPIYLAGTGVYLLRGGALDAPLFHLPGDGFVLLALGQVWTVVCEEYGWRGFLQPALQSRFGSLASVPLVALIWCTWHLPMFFMDGTPQLGAAFGWFWFEQTMWSLFMAYLFHASGGSVLTAMLYHAFANFRYYTMADPPGSWGYTVAFFVLTAAVTVPFLPRPLVAWPWRR